MVRLQHEEARLHLVGGKAQFYDRHHSRPFDLSLDLLGIGVVYFVLAKIGLTLASINSSTSAIWPATGFALAAALMGLPHRACSPRCVVRCQRNECWINLRGNGDRFGQHARSALGCVADQSLVRRPGDVCNDDGSRQIRVGLRCEHEHQRYGRRRKPELFRRRPHRFRNDLDDLVARRFGRRAGRGALYRLWAAGDLHSFERAQCGVRHYRGSHHCCRRNRFQPAHRAERLPRSLGVFALPPLLWAALRRDPRETATVVIILCVFAVWGTLAGSGPFARVSLNDSFLLLVMFFISISVPSMALSADVLMRRRSEQQLRHAHDELAASTGELRDTAERLQVSSGKLEERVEQRTQELKKALQQQTALAEVFKEISRSSFDLQKLLNQLVDLASRLCAANSASIWRPSARRIKSQQLSAISRSTQKD